MAKFDRRLGRQHLLQSGGGQPYRRNAIVFATAGAIAWIAQSADSLRLRSLSFYTAVSADTPGVAHAPLAPPERPGLTSALRLPHPRHAPIAAFADPTAYCDPERDTGDAGGRGRRRSASGPPRCWLPLP
jgi:hypothetical protein